MSDSPQFKETSVPATIQFDEYHKLDFGDGMSELSRSLMTEHLRHGGKLAVLDKGSTTSSQVLAAPTHSESGRQ